ncbi:MAG: leucine-rich repeat domain-containing protein [Anaeroplasma bactoclasticum]|nr:leucine-rich repeat domain-containing protein [Anaeroplasma bactoclasticum]MCM1556379.1 leucine-rich repeat domain-containing protein [Anaeroplasma bactoclasticum]
MRKIHFIFILIAVVSFIFTGCSSKNDSNTYYEKNSGTYYEKESDASYGWLGFKMYLSSDKNSYAASIHSNDVVIIPSEYKGKPVTSIINPDRSNNKTINKLFLPNTITSIGEYAFKGCSSLTSITIPDSVTNIGESAFENCSDLRSITIPDSVTSIGEYAFKGCSSLTSITIPESVTSIGGYAFKGCNALTSITIPFVGLELNGTSNTLFGIIFEGYGYSYDTGYSNGGCVPSSLKKVIIKGGKSIEKYAFKGCSDLTSITIPESVTSIGESAFSYCSSLTSITIPESVTSIGKSAFFYCSSLTSITIPESVTSIGESAFSSCEKLTNIFYEAPQANGEKIYIGSGNSALTNAIWYYYSETKPASRGNYWHYVNGVPTKW